MPTDKHQTLLKFLFVAFFQFFEVARGGNVQFAPLRLRIRPGKFREPDLLLLLSASDPRRQDRFWLGADLALEVVSEEKPERDKRGGVRLHGNAGIAEARAARGRRLLPDFLQTDFPFDCCSVRENLRLSITKSKAQIASGALC